MKNIFDKIFEKHALIYKSLLYIFSIIFIVYLLPKGGQFKYEFQKGKPWQYENYYAPFDLAIQKNPSEIKKEEAIVKANQKFYVVCDTTIPYRVASSFKSHFLEQFKNSNHSNEVRKLNNKGLQIIHKIYNIGLIDQESEEFINSQKHKVTILRKGNRIQEINPAMLIKNNQILSLVSKEFQDITYDTITQACINTLLKVIEPNVTYDKKFTEKSLDKTIGSISKTKGKVTQNELIIMRGDLVAGKKLEVLNSVKNELQSQIWSQKNYTWVVLGYGTLTALVLLMLLLFLKKYRYTIYENNTKVTFIFFNLITMIFIVTLIVKFNPEYVYVAPICILPIVTKAFFDARLGFLVHALTVLLLGFIVPNSFEFIFLQIIAGIVTILTIDELHKRAHFFISIGQVTITYMIAYIAFALIQEGGSLVFKWQYFGMFALNGILSFLAMFLILVYEKTFNLVSDVSLLELSNTNTKLLRELAEKAPGTFQHSIQVANLAEAVANEINANALLVRTGALYHDIGKMLHPMYFTENQSTGVNPHNELVPSESTRIIVNHVSDGIALAKKNRLPDRIIDFIRTHHGTSSVYYFYRKALEVDENIKIEDFKYPGPVPFSKETAILMMCDSVEAASKSLKNPNTQSIDDLVEFVINKQMENEQFMNATITFKDILTTKIVLKKKLKNIYHVRIEYPK